MKTIEYKIGDLFVDLPISSEKSTIVIPHIVNNCGAFGSGFVVPLGIRFPKAKEVYLRWAQTDLSSALGKTEFVQVADYLYVAHMCAQSGLISAKNPRPIKYEALVQCLRTVSNVCKGLAEEEPENNVDIYAPAFGSNRSGGNWGVIEPLILEILGPNCRSMRVYTLSTEEQARLFKESGR